MSGTLAVVSQSGKSLSFFDLASGERTALISDLIAEPHELCHDEKRNLLYLSHAYRHGHFWKHGDASHEISIIDPVEKVTVDTIDVRPSLGPHGLAIDPEQDMLYASFEETILDDGSSEPIGGVMSIDLKTRKVVTRTSSGTKSHWFVKTLDSRKAYTCNKTAPYISILDLENQRMTGKIEVPGCEEPALSLDGRFAYFPTPGRSFSGAPNRAEILVIDTATDKVVASIPLKHGAQSVHVTSNGKLMVGEYFFAKDEALGKQVPHKGILALYDLKSYALLGEVEIGFLTLTLRSTRDGSIGFVADIGNGTVMVVDLPSMTVIKTLVVDTKPDPVNKSLQGAHGMVFFP